MRVDIGATIDTETLAYDLTREVDEATLLEFVLMLDYAVCDAEFTDRLIARLQETQP